MIRWGLHRARILIRLLFGHGHRRNNLNFLGLPIEIRLVICRYLSSPDIKSLSQVSANYRRFVDEYFLCDEIRLLEPSQTAGDPENRYVLSINVDFVKQSPAKRARSVEAAKLMKITELKDVLLHSDCYDHVELQSQLSMTQICPWFSEISFAIIRNAFYIQSIDLTLFKCQDSLTAMETLAKNANHLKNVTLRRSMSYVSEAHLEELKSLSLSRMIASLVAKSAITSLHLIDFHLKLTCRDWWAPDADTNIPHLKGHLLSVKSKTLQNLKFTTSSRKASSPDYIGNIDLNCPQLTNFFIVYGQKERPCLYHLRQVAPGVDDSLAKHSPKCRYFNGTYVKYRWYWDECAWSCPYPRRRS